MWLRSFLAFACAATAIAADPVAQLIRRIEERKTEVRFEEPRGYLPWLLQELDIAPESQILVFSKTSVQSMRIEPSRPRALYFNDSVIASFVPGGSMELAVQDPKLGIIFYQLDQSPYRYRQFMAQPKPAIPIARRTDCATCHLSKSTGAMETLIRSVTPDVSGIPLGNLPILNTDNRTRFDRLWGGWYVTGKTTAKHSGNLVMKEGKALHIEPTGTSDIVALLVFGHQMRVMTLISRALSGNSIDELADAMLFEGESPLPAKVEGTSGYAEKFTALGPRDQKGRSLRDLDLNRRLMRYPCSYMIYSDAFGTLPLSTRSAVYRRMRNVLSKRDPKDSRAILEILQDTKPDFTN